MTRLTRWPNRSSIVLLTAAALWLLPVAVCSAQKLDRPPQDNGVPEAGRLLRDGVVVDPSRGVAYAMGVEGGVEAIDLASGAVRWTSKDAAKPLHLTGGLLVAQAEAEGPGVLELMALDVDRAGSRRMQATMALEQGIRASVDDLPGSMFRCQVGGSPTQLMVGWRQQQVVDRRFELQTPALDGAAPSPQTAGQPAYGVLAGAAMIDMATGRVTPIESEAIAMGSLTSATLVQGELLAGVPGRQSLSADGGHVLASEMTGAPGEWAKYRWSVYTAAGELLGRIQRHTAVAPFVVSGRTLVFEERPYTEVKAGELVSAPLSLRAVDLASGAELWSRPIRDTDFRGPFQP